MLYLLIKGRSFPERIREKLGYRARGRTVLEAGSPDVHQLRELESPYGDSMEGDMDNGHPWNP